MILCITVITSMYAIIVVTNLTNYVIERFSSPNMATEMSRDQAKIQNTVNSLIQGKLN